MLQDAMAEQGARIAASMVRLCHELDPTRVVSAAVNGDNEKGVSVPLDIIGFNYNTEKCPKLFHKKYPKRPIFGSETSSAISTRGVYTTDRAAETVNSYDGVGSGARRRKHGGSSTARMSGKPADLPGLASTIAASRLPTDGLRSARSSASSTRAGFRRTTSITTRRGGGRNPRCICSRTGTGMAERVTRSRYGFTRTWTRWSSL